GVNLLKQDHRTVEGLFQEYERAAGMTERDRLCQDICTELTIHSEIEEQCFYPGVRSTAGLEDMVEESLKEHMQVKQLCSDIQGMTSGDARISTRMAELKQAVEHHVKEEERDMFPQVREMCDQQWLLGIGQAMIQQKVQLMERMTSGLRTVREDVTEPTRTPKNMSS
ncbi:MAG TPA: hemerythrin domain-containing protein, partial [Chloroflexota bacterium]